MRTASLVTLGALAALACGSGLRTVPTGSAPTAHAESIIVEYPPPPAEVEVIPDDPGAPCAWMDGYWDWAGRRWNWVPGAWVVPPEGCYRSTPVTVWLPSEDHGELYYLRSRWYPDGADGMDATELAEACDTPTPCGQPASEAAGR